MTDMDTNILEQSEIEIVRENSTLLRKCHWYIMIDSRNDTPSMWALAPCCLRIPFRFSSPLSARFEISDMGMRIFFFFVFFIETIKIGVKYQIVN